MLTKKQVLKIGKYYIEPLFRRISPKIDIDVDEGLVSGHCYYYAKRLIEFLQGEWKYRDVSTLTEDEKEQRRKETGKICPVFGTHYIVEYNGNYYDGNGAINHSATHVNIWEYENPQYNGNSVMPKKISELGRIEYGEPDGAACFCMDYYKDAIWDIYDLLFKPYEREMISKLESASKDENDAGFDAILNIYYNKSTDLLDNDPATKIKIDEIVKEVRRIDKEKMEAALKKSAEDEKKRMEENAAKGLKRWCDMTPEEIEAFVNSEEYLSRFDYFNKKTSK